MLGGNSTAYAARPRDDVPDVEIRAEDGSGITTHGGAEAVRHGRDTGAFAHPRWGPPAERKQISVTYLDQYRIVGGQISELMEPGISPECRTSTQCLQHRLGGSRASSNWF